MRNFSIGVSGNRAMCVAASVAACSLLPVERAAAVDLEEIVVTAQKRTEDLQEVPISISAVSGETLRETGVSKLQDLSIYVPTLQINEATGTDSLFIRGLGSGINMGFEQSVGLVIDGVYYGRGRYTRGSFLDVERVEVLKGPQGTLFGKNTTSGVVNITTARPTRSFEGWASGLYEVEDQERTFEGAVSGPLGDTLSARAAFRYSKMDGWVRNITTGKDDPRSEDWQGRVSLLWEPSDDLSFSLRYQHSDFEQTGRNTVLIKCSPAIVGLLARLGSAEDCRFGDERSNVSPKGTGNPYEGEQQDTKIDSVSLSVDWRLGEHTLTSVTGYSHYDYRDAFTSDHVPASISDGVITENYKQFSQELRVASPTGNRIEYIAGVFYQHTDLDAGWDLFLDFPTYFGAGPAFSRLSDATQKSETWALFGQLKLNVTDRLGLTVGARYSDESKDATNVMISYPVRFDPAPTVPGTVIHDVADSRSEGNFAPMANITWHVNDDIMTYATVSKGFKGGGYDMLSPFPQSAASNVYEFDKEKVLAYEAGAKMSLLGGAAELNLAVFRSEFKNLQVSSLAPGGVLNFFVANAAAATSQGVELDGRWQVTDAFFLGASAAVLDSTYDKFPTAACYALQTAAQGCVNGVQDLSGADLQFAPKFKANVRSEYRWSLPGDLGALVGVDLIYSGKYSLASDNDPVMVQKAYAKVDARVAVQGRDERWEIALIGKNLTNEKTTVWGNDAVNSGPFLGTYYKHLDRTRTFAIKGTVRF